MAASVISGPDLTAKQNITAGEDSRDLLFRAVNAEPREVQGHTAPRHGGRTISDSSHRRRR